MYKLLLTIACLCCLAALPPRAGAHGSVTAEDDLCIIRIGFYQAHFKVFLPQERRQREFCEDLPEVGEAVFVMEYIHGELGQAPIEFRILRNVTGMGRFANLEDVRAIEDLDSVTVFHQPPTIEPDVYSIIHRFEQEGRFLGLVTITNPDTAQVYVAVFPFQVGFTGFGYWPLFIGLGALVQLLYWVMSGGYGRWRAARSGNAATTLGEKAHVY